MNISIYAASTLHKFTNQILIEGFKELSVNAKYLNNLDTEDTSDAVIFQLHGAPQAENDDKAIINLIQNSLSNPNDKRKKIIMIHRPDEIQQYSELKEVLALGNYGLVNYGENHFNDSFYPADIKKKVIPHGFSSNVRNYPSESNPVLIGAHTSWGEMRSLKQALILIGETFKQYEDINRIFGYIGGKPLDLLQIDKLQETYKDVIGKYSINLMDANDFSKDTPQNTIFISQEKVNLPVIPLSFNVQMYKLHNKVRTGEASGTIYRSISIPVILEMNGSNENLKVIKVPYSNSEDYLSADLVEGARKIVECINDGSYRGMIFHNLQQAKIWDEKKIAKEYLDFLDEL